MSSWDDFCNTSHNVLLIKPENYHLPVEDVFIQICSINSSQLIFEVNQLLELQTMVCFLLLYSIFLLYAIFN